MLDIQTNPSLPKKNIEAFQALLEIDDQERRYKARQDYLKAYALSLLIPPAGVYYFFKYILFSNRSVEDIRAGCIALLLTTISGVFSIWLMSLLFQTSPSTGSTKNSDMLKEMITPANMQEIRKLFQ